MVIGSTKGFLILPVWVDTLTFINNKCDKYLLNDVG